MYEDKTYETILDELLLGVPGDTDTTEGSIIFNAIAPVAWKLSEFYATLDNFLLLVFVDTAPRKELILRARERGIVPYPATYAILKGEFNIEVAIDSSFSLDDLDYTVIEHIEGTTCKLECNSIGTIGNRKLGILTQNEFIEGLEYAKLTELLVPGTEEEETEPFRERLLAKMQRPSTSGNANDYYNWAMECPGVGAVKVFPLSYGPGTVKLVITDEEKAAASPELIANVTNHINEVRPIGATVTIVSAVEKIIDITAKVFLSKSTSLGTVQGAFSDSVTEYLKNNAFKIKLISLARIGNLLIGIPGVEDYTDLTINGIADNLPIKEEEVAVNGMVHLEVVIF